MEYVIMMLVVNALGLPVNVGAFPAHYATHELCEAARPAAVAMIQLDLKITAPGDKVADSKCVTQDAIDKASQKVPTPPLKGQRDARIN
jgi:hypothetical protein